MVGLADEAMADIKSSYGSEYQGPDRKPFAVVRPSRGEYGWSKRNAFRQPLLEACLARGLKRRPTVTQKFETSCVAHEDDGVRVLVKLRDASASWDVTCDYFVGADGGRSRTRKEIGATMTGTSFKEESWLVIDLHDTCDPFRDTLVVCDPERPVLSVPGPHGTRRYEMRMKPGETVEEMERPETVRALLRQYGPDGEAPIDRICVYTFHARIADRWRSRRVFLAGDAAHLTPPFAGQGMNAGLRDATNLAWKLTYVLQGRLGPGLLETYQQERKPHALSMINLAINMGRVMAPHSKWFARATRAVFRGINIWPGAREWLAQMRFKPPPRFDRGLFIGDNALAKKLAGTMFPQPLVEHNEKAVLLDHVLGDGFAILCYGREPAALAGKVDALAQRLGACVVGCLPQTYSFASKPIETMVRDMTSTIGELLNGQDAAVVLRPDRYVAAVILDGEESQTLALLNRIVEATSDGASPNGSLATDVPHI
jgi:3-(3-hydroxy-phenyl)propionate hydroxylase